MSSVPGVVEVAAIAVPPPGGGPEQLVAFAVVDSDDLRAEELAGAMQAEIRTHLNPLFRLHDVVIVASLPRTASHKLMRRVLRAEYSA